MTPQSNIMVVAPIRSGCEAELEQLLSTMNREPGLANPLNSLVPFGKFETVHFARFVILADQTGEDLQAYGCVPPSSVKYLAFLCDCDGSADQLRRELVAGAEQGLRQVFSSCESFGPESDLLRWMEAHERPPATMYNNWLGRTVRQVREEDALMKALELHLQACEPVFDSSQCVWGKLRDFVIDEQKSGRLPLTRPSATPLEWQIKNLLHAVGVPLLLIVSAPLLLLCIPIFLIQLRIHEGRDPVIAPRPVADRVAALSTLEDRVTTNQFSAYGNVKPGFFRRWTLTFIFFLIEYTTRHIYNRGFLARVNTIHFARWVFLDNHRRLFFASNYDGSLEAYMGDFINKVAWGLNIVFSNGVGYPKTNWLVRDGAKDEQTFKDFLRRHQLATVVWYDATPGITAYEMERNSRIRKGIEKRSMSNAESSEWLALF